jgi:hypothetical protein
MKIKMLKSTNCDGKPAPAGKVIEASTKDGRFLINTGMAVEHIEAVKPKPKAKKAPVNRMTEVSETRDAG